jgi:hypothetical protein
MMAMKCLEEGRCERGAKMGSSDVNDGFLTLIGCELQKLLK